MTIPELISRNFLKIQWVIGISSVLFLYSLSRRESKKSHFKVRESDRKQPLKSSSGADLASASLKKPKPDSVKALQLPGINLQGEAHEILGVKKDASEAEVITAYKDAVKRFHPDRIQGKALEQIDFYIEATAKINQAKETLLTQIKNRPRSK